MKPNTQSKPIRLTLVALIFWAACNPIAEPAYYTPPDVPAFDGGLLHEYVPANLCSEPDRFRFDNRFSPYFGGTDTVDIDVVEFGNFACPHCANFAALTHDIWDRRPDFRKRVRVYFHHYPFDTVPSWDEHRAAVAASNQGMEAFWAMHDFIFGGIRARLQYMEEELTPFAEDIGLDMEKYRADLEAVRTIAFLQWDKQQCLDTGASGTPTVFVCGEEVYWPDLEAIVDRLLNP